MTPMPEKSSRRSSSVTFSGSKPWMKIRFEVSSRPAWSQPAEAFCSASFSARDLGLLHFLHDLRQWKLLLPQLSHVQSPPGAAPPPPPPP